MESNNFSAEGRIRRTTYWLRWLMCFGINLFLVLLRFVDPALVWLSLVFTLLLAVFIIIQGIKRTHDVNKSGWYILIPIYNLVLALTDGTAGPMTTATTPRAAENLWTLQPRVHQFRAMLLIPLLRRKEQEKSQQISGRRLS